MTDCTSRTAVRWLCTWVTGGRVRRGAIAGSLVVLTGSINSWQTEQDVHGTILVSPAPAVLIFEASIESEGSYNGGSDGNIDVDLLLLFSATTESLDECLDLTVVVRDQAGEIVVDDSRPDHEYCEGLLLSPPPDACAGQLPGRCNLTFEVEVSSPQELELNWTFQAMVVGTLHCNEEQPPTTVDVARVNVSQ